MARQPADPFGFAAAINWDAVEKNFDKIEAIFEKDAQDHETLYGEDARR